jgi:hypothetical protein
MKHKTLVFLILVVLACTTAMFAAPAPATVTLDVMAMKITADNMQGSIANATTDAMQKMVLDTNGTMINPQATAFKIDNGNVSFDATTGMVHGATNTGHNEQMAMKQHALSINEPPYFVKTS